MIQDIAPHRMDNQYRPDAVPQENSPILIFTGSRTENVMAHVSEGHMRYPLYREMPEGITYTYLFSIDETGYFMGIVSKEAENLLPGELQEVIIHIEKFNTCAHCSFKDNALIPGMNKLRMTGYDRIVPVN